MRVLHVSPYFAPAFGFGGPPRSILALCRAQQAAGLDVEVFTTTANGAVPLPPAPHGTRYDGVPVRYFDVRGPSLFFWAPALASALRAAAPRADVIHAHGLFNAPTWQAHRTARRSALPLVVSVRGMLEPPARAHHAWRKRASWSLFDRSVSRDAALLHTTSAAETAGVRTVAPHAQIVEIPNAVDVACDHVEDSQRLAIRRRLGLDPSTPFVLFLGRLHPIKRLDLLALAFAEVAGRHPDVQLVIAGDGDPQVRRVAESQLGDARSRTLFLGSVEGSERDALLAEAATLVLCSDSENFGMSVAEALVCGVAPVVTRTCPWELLERESVGYWVPQTAAAIADAIDALLRDADRARAMGARGRRLAAERFGLRVVGAQWAAEYARLTAPVRG